MAKSNLARLQELTREIPEVPDKTEVQRISRNVSELYQRLGNLEARLLDLESQLSAVRSENHVLRT